MNSRNGATRAVLPEWPPATEETGQNNVREKTTMKTPKQAAHLFFLRNAGYSYDPKTQTPQQGRAACARRLAKAERDARQLGYTFEWSDDWTIGNHLKEYGECYANGEPSTCESCLMRNAAGEVVQSLSCIDDATREYRRVVEAELALEEVN